MSQLNLNTILESVQTILENANVDGGVPIDLSSGLKDRVKRFYKYSPTYLEPGRDKMPAVHIWIESKDVLYRDISINQLNGKREATLAFKIAGFIALDDFVTQDVNRAEEECRTLMENIERVLRSNDLLGNTVDRYRILNVNYFDLPYSESVTFKAALLSLEAKKQY